MYQNNVATCTPKEIILKRKAFSFRQRPLQIINQPWSILNRDQDGNQSVLLDQLGSHAPFLCKD